MLLRRLAWTWAFAAALVLPLWVLTGYAIWGAGTAGFLGVAILAPGLVVAELGLAAVHTARRSVRASRRLGVSDSALLAVFSAAVIGAGFFGPATTWFGVLAVAALIGAYWLAVAELMTEVRTRVRTTLTALGIRRPTPPMHDGEYIVLPPPRSADGRRPERSRGGPPAAEHPGRRAGVPEWAIVPRPVLPQGDPSQPPAHQS